VARRYAKGIKAESSDESPATGRDRRGEGRETNEDPLHDESADATGTVIEWLGEIFPENPASTFKGLEKSTANYYGA